MQGLVDLIESNLKNLEPTESNVGSRQALNAMNASSLSEPEGNFAVYVKQHFKRTLDSLAARENRT